MTAPQRVDVERLPAKWRSSGRLTEIGTARHECADELEAALPALLQQVAEQAAEIERLVSIGRGMVDASWMDRANQAERAREEAISMAQRIVNFSDREMGDGDTARSECAAYLAANDSRGQNNG